MIKITADNSHIFFDRYDMTDEEKNEAGERIIKKAFSEAFSDFDVKEYRDGKTYIFSSDDEMFLIEAPEIAKKVINIMKAEFAIFASPGEAAPEPEVETSETTFAESIIRKNYMYEDLTASRVAEHAGMEKAELDKYFVRYTGLSVSRYIKSLRVIKAAELMRGGIDLGECAYLCGFGSEKTMTRAFETVLGATPAALRDGKFDGEITERLPRLFLDSFKD